MKKIRMETVCKKMLADVYTPVGIYLRLRDRFRDTVLLESTDHHAAENSWSFMGVQAIGGIEVKDLQALEFKYPGQQPEKQNISNPKDLTSAISTYLQRYETSGDKSIPAAQSLFGYTAYDAIRFFENLTPQPTSTKETSAERSSENNKVGSNELHLQPDSLSESNEQSTNSSNPLLKNKLTIATESAGTKQSGNEINDVQEPFIKYSVSTPKPYELARQLKHTQTKAESILWDALRNDKVGEKFRRRHPINAYIVDYVCLQKALIVEVDGGFYNDEEKKMYDEERTEVLTYIGFRLIRFTNEEILKDLKKVLLSIKSALTAAAPLHRLDKGASLLYSTQNSTVDSKESNSQNSSQDSGSNIGTEIGQQSLSSTESKTENSQSTSAHTYSATSPVGKGASGEVGGVLRYRLYQYVIAINHFKDELYICENQVAGLESEVAVVESLIRSRNVPEYPFATSGEESGNMSNESYMEMVERGKAACRRGDVFQIVLSRRFQQGFTGDEFNVYRALRSVNPSPYLFYFDYGDYRLFGSSPESQLVIQNGKAVVHPIAGTFKRTGDDLQDEKSAEQLLADPKENAEHVMLVDLARNDMSRHAQNVKVSSYRKVHYYSHVIHLVSEVTGQVSKETNPYDVFAATFPAGTLSGAPKVKAMQLINQWEPTPRGYYGGAIGLLGLDGSFNHAIMIRTFLSRNNTLHYQAGAGITVNSVPENELKEVTNKLGALKKAITLAEGIHS